MGYRKNFWYILGVVLALASAVVMAVSMIFMYFGSNPAIVVFFAACPTLVIGIFLSGSVKRRYEDADADGTNPVPMFYTVRYCFYKLRLLVAEKGFWRVAVTALTAVALITTLVFAGLCGSCAYRRYEIKNDAVYTENEVLYNEYHALWLEARNSGDTESAHEYAAVMDKYHLGNAEYRSLMDKYSAELRDHAVKTALFGAVTVFFGSVLALYLRKKRKARKMA